MIKKIIALALLASFASGCSIYSVTSNDITTDYYPTKKVLTDVKYVEKIDKPHMVIGYVTVNAERRQSMEGIMQQMLREAAILGGDAITNIKTDASGTWKKLPAQQLIGNAYVRANFSAAVVVYK
jgi:hypothetical protein